MKKWIEIPLKKPVSLKTRKLYRVNEKGEIKELEVIKGTIYAKETYDEGEIK